MKTDPNAPAFAKATENRNLIGLTKREYFAASALQGLVSTGHNTHLAALRAVQLADDLIAKLNNLPKATQEAGNASKIQFEESGDPVDAIEFIH